MEITKIELCGYKSIKEPVTVRFCDGLPMVLIGKNGSGKTNILEALEIIASANSNRISGSTESFFNYKVWISLSTNDVELLFPDQENEAEKCELIAMNGKDGMKIDRIQSSRLVPLLRHEIGDIEEIAENLDQKFATYQQQFSEIIRLDDDSDSAHCYAVKNANGYTTNIALIKWQIESSIQNAKELIKALLPSFHPAADVLYFPPRLYMSIPTCQSFKLQFEKPKLAPFEQKFITIDEAAIEKDINRINMATEETCKEIDRLTAILNERVIRLNSALDSDDMRNEEDDERFFRFFREVRRVLGKKCVFLKNENNDVIFREEPMQYLFYRQNRARIILETYQKKMCPNISEDEKPNDGSLTENQIVEFENYLNNHLPDFERDMYNHVSVEKIGENDLTIVLHEKTGDKIDLNMTSAGRRWYFTYYFMKNTLEEGDTFFIDEPAGMLHPTAQKEILKELLELAKNGIRVIYSTHSPYLIPEEWKCVNFVSMGEKGTEVMMENDAVLYDEKLKEITGKDIFTLQEIVEKFKSADTHNVARRCYEAVRKKDRDFWKAAEEMNLSRDTILSWNRTGKHFRSPKLETLFVVSLYTKKEITDFI